MPPRRSRSRFLLIVLVVVFGTQVPATWVIGRLTGQRLAVSLLAFALTVPFLGSLSTMRSDDHPRGAFYRYVLLWPFFVWWTSCLVFVALGLLAWPTSAILAATGHGSGGVALPSLLLGVSGLLGGWATWRAPRLDTVDLELPGLPAALDGLTIAQISDIHCGSYTPPERVAAWCDTLTALKPDLIAVTGDLVTSGNGFVDAVAEALGHLRARLGVYACLGNHDYFCDSERLVHGLERAGLIVLRNSGVVVDAAATGQPPARLYIGGTDDTWTQRADCAATMAKRPPELPAVVLAHDPNLFPELARLGALLTLSGHTHGGQMALPILPRRFTLARLITRFPSGLYRDGAATLYVNRGAGTTGPPVRLFVPAELSLLRLRAR